MWTHEGPVTIYIVQILVSDDLKPRSLQSTNSHSDFRQSSKQGKRNLTEILVIDLNVSKKNQKYVERPPNNINEKALNV